MTRWWLAEVLLAMGEDQARAALEALLLIWKDADPDNVLLQDVRARLTRS